MSEHPKWLAALALSSAVCAAAANAASVTDIRITHHAGHIRVELDLDAPASFSISDDGSLTLKGISGGNAVLKASAGDAPLERVLLSPAPEGARLVFETKAPIAPRAFSQNTDKENRLIVDLLPKDEPPGAKAEARAGPGHSAPSRPPADAPKTALGKSKITATPLSVAVAPSDGPPMASAAKSEPAVPGMPPDVAEPPPALEGPALSAAARAAAPGAPLAASPPGDPGYAEETWRAERALDRGDAKAACAQAEGIVKSRPKDLRALVVLGGCRMALGDAFGAKGAFQTALEADPSFDRARVGLATAQDLLGDHASAEAQMAQVLAHNVPPAELAKLVAAFRGLPPSGQTSATAPK